MIEQFGLLKMLFGQVIITPEVHYEVVVAGEGLFGAHETASATWIQVRATQHPRNLATAQAACFLGAGELSTLVLAREVEADLLLLDDLAARKLAMKRGFRVQGTIGLLETCFIRGHLTDLKASFVKLLNRGIYLNRDLLNSRLRSFSLPLI